MVSNQNSNSIMIDIDDLTAKLARLSHDQLHEVCKGVKSNAHLLEAWIYIFNLLQDPETANTFCVPAMLVAGIAGRAYVHRQCQSDIVQNVLSNYGKEGIGWKFFKPKDLFNNTKADLIYKLTALSRGPVIFRYKCGNAAKFAYVTPRLALELLVTTHSPRRERFVKMLIEMSNALLKYASPDTITFATAQVEEALEKIGPEPEPAESQHNALRDSLASERGGKIESRNECGIADVETKSEVIEVKPVSQWMHGLGQALAYGNATHKRSRLVLFGTNRPPSQCYDTCKKYKVDVEFFQR